MEAVAEGLDLRIMLPKVLLNKSKGTTDGKGSAGTGPKTSSAATSPEQNGESEKPNKKKRKKPTTKAASTEETSDPRPSNKTPTAIHTNPSVQTAWKPPLAGADYLRYFPGRMPGILPWPRLTDSRRKNAAPAQLCVRFQATGKCSMACAQAHVTYEEMKKEDQEATDKIFKEVYASDPAPL